MTKKTWFYVSMGGVVVSILSLLTPIITYRPTGGELYQFNIIDLLCDPESFEYTVLRQYNGPVVWRITGEISAVLAVIAVAAVLCAVIGLVTLKAQRPNTWQFILTIVGLVGVAVPSEVLLVCILGFGWYFDGSIGFGPAPIITPIAMLVCIAAVVRRKNRVAEEIRRELEAEGMIWTPTDRDL